MKTQTTKTKRQYRSAQQWQHLINDFTQSGLSQSEFCRQHSVTPSALWSWRKKLGATFATQPVSPFIEIPPPPPAPAPAHQHWDVELELGGGRILRVRVA